ncbi:unnamed protein product [Heterobilharzia americana]|nr:unnamed protein product [Heterobilharzia americana]
MERFSRLALLNSQPSEFFKNKNLLEVLNDLQSSERIQHYELRDLILCVGNAIRSYPEEALKQFDLLLPICDHLFEKSFLLNEPTAWSLLKSVLEEVLQPLAKTSVSTAYRTVEKFLVRMLKIVSDDRSEFVDRCDVAASLNSILSGIPSKKRNKLWDNFSLKTAISSFGGKLRHLGDFDLQAHSSALLLRLIPRDDQEEFALTYITPEFPSLARKFSNIGGINFEFEIRPFLNTVNGVTKVNPKVVSLPCESLKLCNLSLQCPKVPNDEANVFWLDFNMGADRITSYCLKPSDTDSQISSCASRGQATWEVLTIYPEFLDCLNIEHLIAMRFTMTERIKDFCEWAPSVSGYVVEAKISMTALDQSFMQLKFTSSFLEEESQEANLVSILSRLQSFRQYLERKFGKTIDSNTQSTVNCQHFGPIANSPISIESIKNESASQKNSGPKLIEKLNPKSCKKPNTSYQSSVAYSPIMHESEIHPLVLIEKDMSFQIHDNVSVASPKAEESSFGFFREILTPVDSVWTYESSSSIRSRTNDKLHQKLSPTSIISNKKTIEAYLDKSTPEKHRKASLQTSPVVSLNVLEPIIKHDLSNVEQESPKNTSLMYAEAAISSGPCEEYVDKLSSTASSARAVCQLLSMSENVNQLITISKEPQIHTPEVISDSSPYLSPTESLKGDVASKSQVIEKQSVSNLCVTEPDVSKPDSSFSLSSFVTEDWPNQEVSSSLEPIAFKPNTSSNSALIGKKYSTSSKHSVCVRTKKLCDVSTSYILDVSPAEVTYPLTPEEYTVISLPKLSAIVHLKGKSRTRLKKPSSKRESKQKEVLNDTIQGSNKAVSPPITVVTTSPSQSRDSDPDYPPLRVRNNAAPFTERRRSARLLNKEGNDLAANSQLDMSSPAPKSDSSSLGSPELKSPTSILQTSIRTPISFQKPIKPTSTFKKRKFFSTTRSKRNELEKKRFQEAYELVKVKKKSVNQKKNGTKAKTQKNMEPKNKYQLRSTSKHLPTVEQAVNVATVPNSMPTDSDQDFDAKIVDPDSETVQTVDEDVISPSWKPSKIKKQIEPVCTKFHNKKGSSLIVLSPQNKVDKDDLSCELSRNPSNNSSAPSLFSMTPPRHFKTEKNTKSTPISMFTPVNLMNNKNIKNCYNRLQKEKSWSEQSQLLNDTDVESGRRILCDVAEESKLLEETVDHSYYNRSPLHDISNNCDLQQSESCSVMQCETLLQHISLISAHVDKNIQTHEQLGQSWRFLKKELSDWMSKVQKNNTS